MTDRKEDDQSTDELLMLNRLVDYVTREALDLAGRRGQLEKVRADLRLHAEGLVRAILSIGPA